MPACETSRSPTTTAPAHVGGGGKVYALGGGDWTPDETPAGENLTAVVRGGTDIAVGSGGTILEK